MNRVKILAVDDEPFNLDLIDLAFMSFENVDIINAVNGQDALDKLEDTNPDVILLDLRMPVMNGIDVLKHLKADNKLRNIPVIVITANSEEKHAALEIGANDFLAKPVDTEELTLRTFNHVELYKHKKHLNQLVEQKTAELSAALSLAKKTEYEISLRLGLASEYRDLETGMHIKRMSQYSALIGRLSGMSAEDIELLLYAAPLHDIGKIGIPDAILLKPGKLDEKEFAIMKQHAAIGGLMLQDGEEYPIIKMGQIIATQHHEKYNGLGYPKGIEGEDIHIFARIVAIADVFDALSSERVYKKAFPLEKALSIMKDGRGTHFDPTLLDLFIENIEKVLEIQKEFPDKDETPHILNLLEENA